MSYRTGSGLKMESDEVGGDYAPTAAHNQRELGTSLAIVSYLTSRRCLPGPSEASLSLFFPSAFSSGSDFRRLDVAPPTTDNERAQKLDGAVELDC